ncbi:MAG: hypothetical protein N4A35_10535 [Flavobacteriales bacterium]|jgi:hypothetical protein|nr:hypothetical protein [Flavobacteriales bacterium]
MKTFLFFLVFISSCLYSEFRAQEKTNNDKVFKVHIGDNALMCPNLGPKLKTNIQQIGGKVLLFDTKENIMLVNTPSNDQKYTVAYILKIVQLTGYPNELITVEEIDKEEEGKLLHNHKQ